MKNKGSSINLPLSAGELAHEVSTRKYYLNLNKIC